MDKIRDFIEEMIDGFNKFFEELKSDKKTLVATIVVVILIVITIFVQIKNGFSATKAEAGVETKVAGILTPIEGEPENNTFYIKTSDGIYKTANGTSNFDGIVKEADNTRIKWYTTDDSEIPTVYKDDLILFYTEETLPTGFVWERFEDLGYTIGVGALSANEAGKYQFQIQQKETIAKYTNVNSSIYPYFTATGEGATYVIDRVDAVKVSSDTISNGGTITGLSYGKSYTVDLYEGTNYIPAEVAADTHAFSSYEIYESVRYGFLQEGYVAITVPENLSSGYYTINNGGLFRYVNNTREEGVSGIDFNKAYYLGVAEDGTIITADNKGDYQSKEDLTETQDSYRYSLYLDSTTQQMDIDVTFNDTFDFIQNADADKPVQAILISPDNEKYELTESERKDNTFTISIIGPEVGTWRLNVYNTGDKYFEVSEVLTSNQADYVNQTGTSKATMTIELEKNYMEGVFDFTWENTKHAAEILVTAPDGSKYGKGVNENDVISEGYGKMSISVPNAKAGRYTIEITGEDLGKVRFYNNSDTGDEINDNITEEQGAENQVSGVDEN